MIDLPRRLAYVPLAKVAPAVANPRKSWDMDGLIASISRFGFTAPLVVDERTGRLVAGHGRLQALVSMVEHGYPNPGFNPAKPRATGPETLHGPPAGIVLDDDAGWLVPVVRGWASRSDAEASAVLVADNRLTENAEWDDRGLARLLESVITDAPDLLDATGFDADALDDLLRQVVPENLDGETQAAAGPEPDAAGEAADPGNAQCPQCGCVFPLRV